MLMESVSKKLESETEYLHDVGFVDGPEDQGGLAMRMLMFIVF
jgi:hypothetical protein